jgi:amidase
MANSMDGQNSVLSVVGPLATNAASLRLITQAILSQKPWLCDPLVHDIPWRSESHSQGKEKMCFAVMSTDGIVTPMPPILRAISLLTSALKAAGHEVIPWMPSPNLHKNVNDTGLKSWIFDGGADVHSAFALSGEPMSEQISMYASLGKQFSASEIANTNVDIRELRKDYLDYWNSTANVTATGRCVDAVICPVAPFPAARPEKFKYYGYSTWVNVLDYTSVVVQVMNVDKGVDGRSEAFEALDKRDEEIQGDCKFYRRARRDDTNEATDDPEIYHGAHVSLQIVGRRLEEEKMIGIAEEVEKLLGKK